MTLAEVQAMIIDRTKHNIEQAGHLFPHVGDFGAYELIDNNDWTNGFWTGIIWHCYEATGDDYFLDYAKQGTQSFSNRMQNNAVLDHHDLGFLFSLSAKADFIVTKDEKARLLAVQAADRLLTRWRKHGGYIQAWGREGDEVEGGRMIIDCLLNLPLLFWASETTGNHLYAEIAKKQADQTLRYLVRGDGSSYHTFLFDPHTAEPIGGATHQGYSNGSTWARGQAWGVYGFALLYRFTGEEKYLQTAEWMLNYYMAHQPTDQLIPWDFNVPHEDAKYYDSSAMAIVLCGMLELKKWIEEDRKESLNNEIDKLLNILISRALIPKNKNSAVTGILGHGSYHVRGGKVPDGSVIWGDYFFVEAIMRMTGNVDGYWFMRSELFE